VIHPVLLCRRTSAVLKILSLQAAHGSGRADLATVENLVYRRGTLREPNWSGRSHVTIGHSSSSAALRSLVCAIRPKGAKGVAVLVSGWVTFSS
jgi:hypothetical protein